MISYFAALSVLLASALYWGDDYHGTRFLTFIIIATLWIAAVTWRRIHWSAGLSVGWALLSAAGIFARPRSPFLNFGDSLCAGGTLQLNTLCLDFWSTSFDALSAVTALCILAVVVPLLFASRRELDTLTRAFGWLCILDSVFVVAQWAMGAAKADRGGFFGETSMNPCVIAFTYPIWTRRKFTAENSIEGIGGLLGLGLPILAIFVSRSNMGLGVLLVAYGAPHLANIRRIRLEHVLKFLCVTVALGIVGAWLMGAKFGQTSGRWPVWVATMQWWWTHASHWMGTGAGSYFVLGPNVQKQVLGQLSDWLLWMHNDWLQVLFEQGVIGLALLLTTFACALRATARSHRYWLVSSLAAYGATMCGNYPNHLPVPGFFGAFLVVLAFAEPPLQGWIKPR